MDFVSMFDSLEQSSPLTKEDYEQSYEPKFQEHMPSEWPTEFDGFRSSPVLYNMDGYISPYASNNWGGTSAVLNNLEDISRLPPLSDKIDPNKIFTSDIAALKTLAADQMKVTRMFEKKLVEGLREKGKVGLNENDIMAMQALTSARSAVTAINKEQIAIKKNIADIRIKQKAAGTPGVGRAAGATNAAETIDSVYDVGRSILDSIFDAPAMPVTESNSNQFQSVDIDQASQVLDNIVGDAVSVNTKYENVNPTTYVLVGESDDDVEFATYSADGELLTDYPNPTTKIDIIDREAGTAIDDLLVKYPIKQK